MDQNLFDMLVAKIDENKADMKESFAKLEKRLDNQDVDLKKLWGYRFKIAGATAVVGFIGTVMTTGLIQIVILYLKNK